MKQSNFEKRMKGKEFAVFTGLKDYKNIGNNHYTFVDWISLDDIESVNDVEGFMNMYHNMIERIDNQYNLSKGKQTSFNKMQKQERSVQEKIDREKKLIETLKFEGEDRNKEMLERAKERLQKAQEEQKELQEKIQNRQTELEEQQQKSQEQKNEKVRLDSGREVTRKEADEIWKNDIKNGFIAFLTQKSMQIDELIPQKQAEAEAKRKAWKDFRYTFDDKHNITNKDELEQIINDFHDIEKQIEELGKIKEACNKNIKELKGPTLEELQEQARARQEAEAQRKSGKDEVPYNLDFEPTVEYTASEKDEEDYEIKSGTQWQDTYETVDAMETQNNNDQKEENGIYASIMGKNMAYSSALKGEYAVYENKSKESYAEVQKRVLEKYAFTPEAFEKVDFRLIDFLTKTYPQFATLIVEQLNDGNDLSKFANLIHYDMRGAKQLKKEDKRAWKEYRKIAKIAEANGLKVEGIEETKNIFDKIQDLFKKKKEPKALNGTTEPEQLEAGKEGQEPEEPTAAQKFKEVYEFHYTQEDLDKIQQKMDEPAQTHDDGLSK